MACSKFQCLKRVAFAALVAGSTWVTLAGPALAGPVWDDVPQPAVLTSQALAQLVTSSPLVLSASAAAAGGQVSASVTFHNRGSSSLSLSGIVIAARDAAGNNADFGGIWGTSLSPGGAVTLQRSRTFTASDPAGTWTLFASYRTADGMWHVVAPTVSLAVIGTGSLIALGATIRDNGTTVYPASGLLAWYASLAGRMPAIVNVGSDFVHSASFDPVIMNYLVSNGTMPMWTWMPDDDSQGAYQPAFTDRAIANGAYDGYIRQFALAVKQWGHPFLLGFAHEMNGTWFSWSTGAGNPDGNSPADFVAM